MYVVSFLEFVILDFRKGLVLLVFEERGFLCVV